MTPPDLDLDPQIGKIALQIALRLQLQQKLSAEMAHLDAKMRELIQKQQSNNAPKAQEQQNGEG